MRELTRFQDAFTTALAGDPDALLPWWEDAEAGAAGLSVYRNTVAKGCADAIVANFPSVERVCGADWLAAAGVRHAAEHPPARPSLLDYGQAFPDWLTTFPPADDMPFLADLARLDLAWTRAHLAADASPLGAAAFAALDAEAFAATAADLHPSATVAGFADGLAGLWIALRAATPPEALELNDAPSAVLILRPALEVAIRPLTAGGFAFLAACRQGQPLALAAAAALAAEPGLDLAALFADLIAAGAFAALRSLSA
ncbi:DNA-binding domain-containing protein [Phenylobacterium aquaticum]|uniref:HvfC/BufC N-terminal domain-containing protein n=1 Tax=Phenylobacterium aquaticum TaxID=1763816 RepID=UPI001F5DCEA4|nr:DNA-binding domain-containing protein [Phenylobacterium aquaticum]MCI3133224.1 DNA-binding domain-containing protein [Phenylobacterium aquaticum]